MKLLTQSILTNGWTLPIVVREDYTIIDGFHRWTVAGEEPSSPCWAAECPSSRYIMTTKQATSTELLRTIEREAPYLLEPMQPSSSG